MKSEGHVLKTADKNKETKAAPKLRQDESITHAKIQSGWKMAQLQS